MRLRKKCIECEHFACISYNGKCTRYPKWVYIEDPYDYWCGEWKKIEDNQEEDDVENIYEKV